MSKKPDQIKPNYAAVYAVALYPALCPIFHRHGYALAAHGSLARDFDLIAVPWADEVSDHQTVLRDILSGFAIRLIGAGEDKPHGRVAYTISIGHGECAIDLSFMGGDRKLDHFTDGRACWCGMVSQCAECGTPALCIHGIDRTEIIVHKQEN